MKDSRRWPRLARWFRSVTQLDRFFALAERTRAGLRQIFTRVIPVAFGLEMLLPAILAPALTHASPPHPVAFGGALVLASAAAIVLGGSRAVAHAAAPTTPLTEP